MYPSARGTYTFKYLQYVCLIIHEHILSLRALHIMYLHNRSYFGNHRISTVAEKGHRKNNYIVRKKIFENEQKIFMSGPRLIISGTRLIMSGPLDNYVGAPTYYVGAPR